jgi:hypothetical protein
MEFHVKIEGVLTASGENHGDHGKEAMAEKRMMVGVKGSRAEIEDVRPANEGGGWGRVRDHWS